MCSRAILEIIKEIINPIFKTHGLSEISIKIGLTYGYALVVLYGNDSKKAHIDMIGSSISLASKIVSIAKPNQILVGVYLYDILLSSNSISNSNIDNHDKFREIYLDPTKWKYVSHSDPESMFRVYEYIEN